MMKRCTCGTTDAHAVDCPRYLEPTLFDDQETGNPTEWGGYGRPGAAPHEAPQTSIDAAHAIEPVSGRLRIQVFNAFVKSGSVGWHDDALELELGMLHTTLSARRKELVNMGRITYKLDANGKKVQRLTRSGRGAFVYVIVQRRKP